MLYANLIARFPEGNVRTASARAAFVKLLETAEAAGKKVDEIKRDGRLTPVGAREKVREYLAGEPRQAFLAARLALKEGFELLRKAREAIRFPALDRADVAGAMLRREIRDKLAALPVNERLDLLGDDADILIVQSAFELPAPLSIVPAESRDRIIQAHLSKAHPAATHDLKRDTAEIEVLRAAVAIGRNVLHDLGAFTTDQELKSWVYEVPSTPENARTALPDLVPPFGGAIETPEQKDAA